MISSYHSLQGLVSGGQLDLIHVIGLPRANGTALHLALTQAPSVNGQLNEPFYYPDLKGRSWSYRPKATETPVREFETGCTHILERYKSAAADQPNQKVTLVVHDLSPDLTDEEFAKACSLDKHTIFAFRDPMKHALSQFTRFVNDQLSMPAGNKIKSMEALKLMADVQSLKDFMQSSPGKISHELISTLVDKPIDEITDEDLDQARVKVIHIFLEEFEISWENLNHFWKQHKADFPHHPYSNFDAAWLFDKPEEHLKELSDRIGDISYTPDMINNWTKGVDDRFECIITKTWGELAKTNAWNGPVRASRGIVKQPDSIQAPLTIDQFPLEMRENIHKMLGYYQAFLDDQQIPK